MMSLKLNTFSFAKKLCYTDIQQNFGLMSIIIILGIQTTDKGHFRGITPAYSYIHISACASIL